MLSYKCAQTGTWKSQVSWINKTLGDVILEMRGHLLVLKASFTRAVSVLYM